MDRRRIEERTGIRGEEGGYRKDDKEFLSALGIHPGVLWRTSKCFFRDRT